MTKIKRRCAWCGRKIKIKFFGTKSVYELCNYCYRLNKSYNNWIIVLLCTVVLITIIIFYYSKVPIVISFILAVLFILFCCRFYDVAPYVRLADTGTKESELVEPYIGDFCIEWTLNERKIFHGFNNAVIFMCFVDFKNQPMSKMLCVRVKKNKGKYTLTRIDERIPMEYIHKFIHMKSDINISLFDEDKQIGKGKLL